MEMNGSAMVAMVGKNCVAIAADRRLGQQAQTLTMDFKKIFQMGPKLMVGLPGLATDVLTVYACPAPAMLLCVSCPLPSRKHPSHSTRPIQFPAAGLPRQALHPARGPQH